MVIVIKIAQLLMGLSILVILHELGHFLAARAFGIKVEKFYLFFDAWGVSIFKFHYKGVEYGMGWLPLGGYVKIAGMIDESMDTEQMAGPPQPWEFRSKPAWQRLIVMLAGIFVNIVLGIFIFWMLTLKNGDTFTPNDALKYGIAPGKTGVRIGLKAGDKITEINGKPIVHFDDLLTSKVLMGNSSLTVVRNGVTKQILVPADILNYVSDDGPGQFIEPRTKFSIKQVTPKSNAEKAHLMAGDSIVAINNQAVAFFDEFKSKLDSNKNKMVALGVKRGTQTLSVNAQVTPEGTLGFLANNDLPKEEIKTYGFVEALPIGASHAWSTFADNAKGLKKVAQGEVKATKAFAGPVAIANMFGGVINWTRFWTLVGFLSMALALMNLLPIPVLDGGHAMFLLIEMVKGKPLSDKFMERAQLVGFVILICLMVFVYGNDILKHVIKY
ncbi:RIP metalloprotease RseP [Mucilaginibacter sp. HMF5004]|uniref:RIP metalloprotease RseP n=1 Tax=Mucilaginibacter rivuli TaxID=2857527 RepID=UPI001C5EC11F|nr:RIP metalloprotease RseP [Mucilaginibacter rivuli]MBW4889943.1 RIP metalloprotease RseP [Mucilaginibacter rivuli]